jgi:hypothetical protein
MECSNIQGGICDNVAGNLFQNHPIPLVAHGLFRHADPGGLDVTAGLHRTHLCRFSIESTIQHASIKTFFLLHLAIFYALWILFTGICNNFRVLMIFPLNCALEKDFDAT